MAESYLCRVTSKGQVTIPGKIRRKLNLATGDYLLFYPRKNEVQIKKVLLSPEEEFDKLAERIEKKFKRLGITRKDVQDAIKWAREKS